MKNILLDLNLIIFHLIDPYKFYFHLHFHAHFQFTSIVSLDFYLTTFDQIDLDFFLILQLIFSYHFRSLHLTESVAQKIEHILDTTSHRESDIHITDSINVTKALLVGTLHSDEVLTSSIFMLLHQHLTYESGIDRLAGQVKLVPTVSVRILIYYSLSIIYLFLLVCLFIYLLTHL